MLVSALRKVAFGAVVLGVALAGHGSLTGYGAAPMPVPPARDSSTDQHNSDTFVAVRLAPPVRLLIPSLGIDAQVEALGVDGSGAMATPGNIWNVGWYQGGPSPGAPGDAVIDGHVGLPGSPLVFSNLTSLAIGAEVVAVLADGTRSRFIVNSSQSWPAASSPSGLFSPDGAPRLTLITCTGEFEGASQTYADRLIVEATYAGPG